MSVCPVLSVSDVRCSTLQCVPRTFCVQPPSSYPYCTIRLLHSIYVVYRVYVFRTGRMVVTRSTYSDSTGHILFMCRIERTTCIPLTVSVPNQGTKGGATVLLIPYTSTRYDTVSHYSTFPITLLAHTRSGTWFVTVLAQVYRYSAYRQDRVSTRSEVSRDKNQTESKMDR